MIELQPKLDERGVLVGMTGSGKTTLAKTMIRLRPRVIVHDYKGRLEIKGFTRYETLAECKKSKEIKIIYAPNFRELANNDLVEKFFEWVYKEKRNYTLYVDEVYGVTTKNYIPAYYHAILTRGRELGISCISSTQRPKDIPQVVLSEAEHYYVFRLQLPQDRKRINDIIPLTLQEMTHLPKHDFFYCNCEGETIGPLKLAGPGLTAV